jgi:hypothetical protein
MAVYVPFSDTISIPTEYANTAWCLLLLFVPFLSWVTLTGARVRTSFVQR